MILKVCGEGPIVPGFPNADIAIATGGNSNGGSSTDWDDKLHVELVACSLGFLMSWCNQFKMTALPISWLEVMVIIVGIRRLIEADELS